MERVPWTEAAAVSALVTHIVHMDNLMLLHARNYKGNICTVGADLHTVLTVAVAGKASSAVCSAFILFCQISLTVRDNLFIRHLKDILGKISSIIASAAFFPSRMPSTTVAGPKRPSPTAYTPLREVSSVS